MPVLTCFYMMARAANSFLVRYDHLMCGAWRETSEGVRLELRVTPHAGCNEIGAVRNGRLLVKVTAAPEDGKANAAVVKLLSKAWHVPASSIEVIHGETSREKSLLLRGVSLGDLPLDEAFP
jgi:uncharacterized protein